MNEEEKNAIEYLKTRLYGNEGCKYIDVAQEDLRIFINLVDRKEKDIEGWKKHCEEIEEEQTEMSNKNCELEFEVEKLQKENEELKNQEATARKINELLVQRYSNSISLQTVKDKIEEYKNMLKTCNKAKDIDRIKAINERILELQELLEGGKEKTADELFDDLGLWLERETPFDFEVKNDDDKVIKFNKERREIACFNYYDGFEYLTLQELQAINKKCQELGWLKED